MTDTQELKTYDAVEFITTPERAEAYLRVVFGGGDNFSMTSAVNNVWRAGAIHSPEVQALLDYLSESAEKMADSDMMFCINGAHDDFSHLPYEDVKAIARRVCGVIASRNQEALAALEKGKDNAN